MKEEINALLKNRKFDVIKLLKYGFFKKDFGYEYECEIIQKEFYLIVDFNRNFELTYKVIDLNSGDEYLPVKALNAVGGYVGSIREKVIQKLVDITDKCSSKEVFKFAQTKQIIKYMEDKYNAEPEFLWEKYDNNAVFRKKSDSKWYAAILTVSSEKFGLASKDMVEVIDLRNTPENVQKLVDNEIYFLAYHMNKKHWFTIILDGRLNIDKIFELIDISYNVK